MPRVVPRLPKARPSEIAVVGAAGVGVLAPLYLMMPGADDKLANQTAKWAPRWERQTEIWAPRWEKNIQRVEPPVSAAVQRLDERLPLEKMAKGVDAGIRKGIARFNPPPKDAAKAPEVRP